MSYEDTNHPVAHPTWFKDIRYMFTQEDITSMSKTLQLNSYSDVKRMASGILEMIKNGSFPEGGEKWSDDQIATFSNWVDQGCLVGFPAVADKITLKSKGGAPESASSLRVRKDIHQLSNIEISTLKRAFQGIIDLGPGHVNSFFNLAENHGYPYSYCMHHIPSYNPWHRAYLMQFEDALRSIPGCEGVTLPYWNFHDGYPKMLTEAPFDKYIFQGDVKYKNGTVYMKKGASTLRFLPRQIEQNYKDNGVLRKFNFGQSQTNWNSYHGGTAFGNDPNIATISGHDQGHNSIGKTMQNQEVAAFDPIFWFFHCNIDRLLWEWQKKMGATDLRGLLTTMTGDSQLSRDIFSLDPIKVLPPFSLLTTEIVDSINNLDVDYGESKMKHLDSTEFMSHRKGSIESMDKFHVQTETALVRVTGINRLIIPGSFNVHIMKDGERLATTGLFQPSSSGDCPNCVENSSENYDFEIPVKHLGKGELEIVVEPLNTELFGDRDPKELSANAKINVRLLMTENQI